MKKLYQLNQAFYSTLAREESSAQPDQAINTHGEVVGLVANDYLTSIQTENIIFPHILDFSAFIYKKKPIFGSKSSTKILC